MDRTLSSSDSENPLRSAWGIQRKAATLGFDWRDIADVFDKVHEEIEEIREALQAENRGHCKRELGDLLFAVVNLARFLDADPHNELLRATQRFRDRFAKLEEEVRGSGRAISACSLEELDVVWERVKRDLLP